MKRISLFALLMLGHPILSVADYGVQGIRTSCTKAGFEISSYALTNQTPSSSVIDEGQGKALYFGTDKRVVDCLVGKHKIKAEFSTDEPRERGECGGAPGSRVTLWVDGTRLMGNQLFNNHCFESLDKVSFSQSEWIGFIFEMCGHTSRGYFLTMEGCYQFKQGTFWSLAKPLNSFPLTDMIANKSLQPAPKSSASER